MPLDAMDIYVVDDDPSIRVAVQRLLRSAGYHPLLFHSAEDFMAGSTECMQGCLVLDIDLPGMSGLDLQERLASSGKRFGVIFITAHDMPQWEERATKAGAVDYLRKPFDEELLLCAIVRAFETKKGET